MMSPTGILQMIKPIQIVDLFAGPGGLGEGFNSLRQGNGKRYFQTLVSAEMEPSAHKTLTLRSFYRLLQDSGIGMTPYYNYLQKGLHPSQCKKSHHIWEQARNEALCIKLGTDYGNNRLTKVLQEKLEEDKNWILIGGPPCQAYSIVGRSRNLGNKEYRPEEDNRHFLYKEYLNVISQFSPSVFVMENVRGILTSKVGKKRIFGQILEDLSSPNSTVKGNRNCLSKLGYTIFSLSDSTVYFPVDKNNPSPLNEENYNAFVVKSENHGIPQARHRVILIGVRNDIVHKLSPEKIAKSLEMKKLNTKDVPTSRDVLDSLPPLRSGLSRGDSTKAWEKAIQSAAKRIAKAIQEHPSEHVNNKTREVMAQELSQLAHSIGSQNLERADSCSAQYSTKTFTGSELECWYNESNQPSKKKRWYNHETRGHMEKDLERYLYCAIFAKIQGRTPRGSQEIYLDSLAPEHANWKSGKFADRFRVVVSNAPSKTITSHISKDGHYFIHYDPYQCRSLTVREAARIQTFPDDYYFEGNRTEQYVQVGNAVPPLLAKKIASQVIHLLT